jgi:hypothetical protein
VDGGKASLSVFLTLAIVTFSYLTMLLYQDDTTVEEYGAVDGMRICWGDPMFLEKNCPSDTWHTTDLT